MALPGCKRGATQVAGTVAGERPEPRNDFSHTEATPPLPYPYVASNILYSGMIKVFLVSTVTVVWCFLLPPAASQTLKWMQNGSSAEIWKNAPKQTDFTSKCNKRPNVMQLTRLGYVKRRHYLKHVRGNYLSWKRQNTVFVSTTVSRSLPIENYNPKVLEEAEMWPQLVVFL